MEDKILCILCVRGGSIRLPKKNMQMYKGKTLIQHAIGRVMKSEYIDKLVFGTEDKEIIKHVEKIRDNIQLKDWHPERKTMLDFEIDVLSKAITQDDVSMYEPVRQIILKNKYYNLIVILQADNPVKEGLIDKCIERFFEMDKKVRGEKIADDKQQFEEVSTFHDNVRTGSVRVITRSAFLSHLPTSKMGIVEDQNDYVDIQYEKDLKKANTPTTPHDTFWVRNKIKEPVQYNTYMIYNHFIRYIYAIEHLAIDKDDTVIDASCGQGYGSFILSINAHRVFGLDVSADYLKTAKSYYNAENLNFSSYETYSLYGNLVDKIVFIETYEHIAKDEIDDYIDDLLGYLKKGGDMFLACPIGDDGPSEYNPHHLNEPSLKTLYDTFRPHFKKIEFMVDQFRNSFGQLANYCLMCMYGYKGEGKNG